MADFIVVKTPWVYVIKPQGAKALNYLYERYPGFPRGLGGSIVLESDGAMNSFIDSASVELLRIEVL